MTVFLVPEIDANVGRTGKETEPLALGRGSRMIASHFRVRAYSKRRRLVGKGKMPRVDGISVGGEFAAS